MSQHQRSRLWSSTKSQYRRAAKCCKPSQASADVAYSQYLLFLQICQGQNDGRRFGNPDNCRAFIECQTGSRVDVTCEVGQLFDISVEACLPSHTVRCGSRGLPPADSLPQRPEDFFPTCPRTGVVYRPHPHNCQGYFICNEGTLIQHSCDAGSHFNARRFQCESPLTANCEPMRIVVPQTPLLPDCTRGGDFFPNLVNCKQYFICVNRQPMAMECPDGFLWNHKMLECELSPSGLCPRH